MNYTRRTVLSFIWVAVAAVLVSVFNYLLRFVLARNFSVAEYGLLFSIISLGILLAVFVTLGLGESTIKYTVSYSTKKSHEQLREMVAWVAIILFSLSLLLFIVIYLLAPWLASSYFKDPAAEGLLQLFFLALVLAPVDIIIPGLFAGLHRLDLHSVYLVVRSGVLLAATLLFLKLGLGLGGAVVAYFVMYAVSYIVFLPIVWRVGDLGRPGKLDTAMPKMLLSYGVPIMLSGVTGIILTSTDTILLTMFSSLEQVGIYQVALPTANILLLLAPIIGTVLLPLLAELWERQELALMTDAIGRIYTYVFVVTLPLVIAALMYPDLIINLLFGPEYVAGAPILRVLSVAALFFTLHAINSAALSGISRPKDTTIAIAVGAAVNVVISVILIPRYGGLGAGIGTLVASVIIFVLSTRALLKVVKVRLPKAKWLKTVLASVFFWGGVRAVQLLFDGNQYVKVLLAVAVGCLLYLLCIVVMRVVTLQELRDLKDRVLKHVA